MDAGQPLNALLQQNGVWQKRQPLFQRAVQRTSAELARVLVQECLAVDRAIKGQSSEKAWDVLLRLTLAVAGRPLFTAVPE